MASAVVKIVYTLRDYVNADLVRILDLAGIASLSAAFFAGVSVNFAVLDFRTAYVIGNFDVAIFAVAALP